jgi:hypothetical protein
MPSARVFPASAQQVADSRNEKYMLPIYGDLLTFPLQLDASEKIKVDWSEDRGHKRSAYYYRIRGWFKRLNRENEPGQSYWTGNWDKAWSVSGGSRGLLYLFLF